MRADDGAQVNFASFLQNLKKDLRLAFVGNRVEEEGVQTEQGGTADFLQALLVLRIVLCLEHNKCPQKRFAVVVLPFVVVAGNNANGLCQIGVTTVLCQALASREESANIYELSIHNKSAFVALFVHAGVVTGDAEIFGNNRDRIFMEV